MYPDIDLANQATRALHPLTRKFPQEEVSLYYALCCARLLLCCLEVEVHIEVVQESRERVRVLVFLGLNDLHDLFQCMLHPRRLWVAG